VREWGTYNIRVFRHFGNTTKVLSGKESQSPEFPKGYCLPEPGTDVRGQGGAEVF